MVLMWWLCRYCGGIGGGWRGCWCKYYLYKIYSEKNLKNNKKPININI